MVKKWAGAALGFVLLLSTVGCSGQTDAKQVNTLKIACAQSLEPIVKQLVWNYESEHRDVKIQLVAGGSRELADKINREGDYDVFLSGGDKELQELQDKQALQSVQTPFLANKLVVIVPEGHKLIKSLEELKKPEFKHIAISDPAKSASGRYTKEVLEKAGLWQELQPRLIMGATVRQAVNQISNDAAEAAIVYHSDVLTDDKVHLALEIKDNLHEPIRYPMAVLSSSKHADIAGDFVKSLASAKSKQRFAGNGFVVDP